MGKEVAARGLSGHPMLQHPYCQVCGWRKGGADSWDGNACKCGLSEPVISETVAADRMWRDPDARARFEAESGLAPLSIHPDVADQQTFSGHTQHYQMKFRGWAMAKISAATSPMQREVSAGEEKTLGERAK